jgi:hypothetical protein
LVSETLCMAIGRAETSVLMPMRPRKPATAVAMASSFT